MKKEIETLQKQLKTLNEVVIEPMQKRLNELYVEEHAEIEKRIEDAEKGNGDFKLDELIFAATNRCECGAGFAYPKGISPFRGAWYCSSILMGRALDGKEEGSKTHSRELHFNMYELKSENQPSANGQTTRPEN